MGSCQASWVSLPPLLQAAPPPRRSCRQCLVLPPLRDRNIRLHPLVCLSTNLSICWIVNLSIHLSVSPSRVSCTLLYTPVYISDLQRRWCRWAISSSRMPRPWFRGVDLLATDFLWAFSMGPSDFFNRMLSMGPVLEVV